MNRLFLLACCALLLSACSHGHPNYRDVPFYLTQDFLSRPPQPVEEPKGFPICWRNGVSDDTACVAALIYDLPVMRLDANSNGPYLLLESVTIKTNTSVMNLYLDMRRWKGAFQSRMNSRNILAYGCIFDGTKQEVIWYKDATGFSDAPLDSHCTIYGML